MRKTIVKLCAAVCIATLAVQPILYTPFMAAGGARALVHEGGGTKCPANRAPVVVYVLGQYMGTFCG